MNTIKAKYSREWRDRMGIILLLLVGSAGWFFYDGLIAYPKYNRSVEAYKTIVDSVKNEGLTGNTAEVESAKRWEKHAHEFSSDPKAPPEHFKNADQQIHIGIGLAILAFLFSLWIAREMRRVICADDKKFDALTTTLPPFNGKTSVQFDAVFGIDRRKWKNKGLAIVHYKDTHGRSRKAIIDDYKYAGTDAILEKCETVIAQKKSGSPDSKNS